MVLSCSFDIYWVDNFQVPNVFGVDDMDNMA